MLAVLVPLGLAAPLHARSEGSLVGKSNRGFREMNKLLRYVACSSIAFIATGFGAIADPTYVTFSVGSSGTFAASINNRGEICGGYSNTMFEPHGFVRSSDGQITKFDAKAGDLTIPKVINNKGEVVGQGELSSPGQAYGFIRSADGTITTFSAPGAEGTYPVGINDRGWIAGSSYQSQGGGFGASFLRSPKGFFRETQPTRTNVYAAALNNSEVTTGAIQRGIGHYVAYIHDKHGPLTKFSVGKQPGPTSINDAGTIVGTAYNPDTNVGLSFVRTADGDIKRFSVPHAVSTIVYKINNKGIAVGTYRLTAQDMHGFIRKPDGTLTLFDVAGFGSASPEWINDKGVVVGLIPNTNMAFIRYP
jgi:hypothetical protein